MDCGCCTFQPQCISGHGLGRQNPLSLYFGAGILTMNATVGRPKTVEMYTHCIIITVYNTSLLSVAMASLVHHCLL